MSGYMVTTLTYGVKEFYMVNSQDPDQACAEVLRCTGGRLANALTPLSDETLAHFKVQPNDPWLCFRTDPNGHAIHGDGVGVVATAFSDGVLEDVGRVELRSL